MGRKSSLNSALTTEGEKVRIEKIEKLKNVGQIIEETFKNKASKDIVQTQVAEIKKKIEENQ